MSTRALLVNYHYTISSERWWGNKTDTIITQQSLTNSNVKTI